MQYSPYTYYNEHCIVLNRKRYFKGLRIRTEDDAASDFLT